MNDIHVHPLSLSHTHTHTHTHTHLQVNKKRHIGNDIVCVVFLDNAQTVFNPSWIRSHFIHCYVVIQRVQGAHGQPLYKVNSGKQKNKIVVCHSTDLTDLIRVGLISARVLCT